MRTGSARELGRNHWRCSWPPASLSACACRAGAARAPHSTCAAPTELRYATSSDGNSDGKITFPVLIFLMGLLTAGKRDDRTRSKDHIPNNAKDDEFAAHSDIETIQGRSAHYRIERRSSQIWNDDWKVSSSWKSPSFPFAVMRSGNGLMAFGFGQRFALILIKRESFLLPYSTPSKYKEALCDMFDQMILWNLEAVLVCACR